MPTEAEIEIVARRLERLRAQLDERRVVEKRRDTRPKPSYLTTLQLAFDAKRRGLPLRLDLARALAEHEENEQAR